MIRWTSQKSFREIEPKIGERQRQVLRVLTYRDMSNREIKNETGLEINTITPRVLELRKMGLVVEKGTKRDELTGKTVTVWGVPISDQIEMNF